jgi:hypothetical protein
VAAPPGSAYAPRRAGGRTFFGRIEIAGSDAYQRIVLEDYQRMYATSTGRLILDLLWGTRHTVLVEPITARMNLSFADAFTMPTDERAATNAGLFQTPVGSDSGIAYNPTYTSPYRTADGAEIAREAWVVLTHETIHALRNATGERAMQWAPLERANFPNLEEENTIGSTLFGYNRLTENALHDELGEPARASHRNRTARTYMAADGNWYRLDDGAQGLGTRIDPPNARVNA